MQLNMHKTPKMNIMIDNPSVTGSLDRNFSPDDLFTTAFSFCINCSKNFIKSIILTSNLIIADKKIGFKIQNCSKLLKLAMNPHL